MCSDVRRHGYELSRAEATSPCIPGEQRLPLEAHGGVRKQVMHVMHAPREARLIAFAAFCGYVEHDTNPIEPVAEQVALVEESSQALGSSTQIVR